MLRRIAEDPIAWKAKASRAGKAGTTTEAHEKRWATMRANGTANNPIAAMNAAMARPDVRAKLSAERKIRFNSPEGREQMRLVAAAAHTPEVNKRRVAASRTYAQTPEGLEAKRRGGDAALRTLGAASATRKWEYQATDGKTYNFRSSWELAFARWLDRIGTRWEYEPATVKLQDGRRYTPDFRVYPPGVDYVWVEIKGVRRYGAEKFQAFRALGYYAIMLGDEEIRAVQAMLS
jgi:hypothetical protein